MANVDVADPATTSKVKVAKPKKWVVKLINDDVTPMEFVIALLMKVFNHNEADSYKITMEVHERGSGVAGSYTFEIAETKVMESQSVARENGFPLKLTMDEEG